MDNPEYYTGGIYIFFLLNFTLIGGFFLCVFLRMVIIALAFVHNDVTRNYDLLDAGKA